MAAAASDLFVYLGTQYYVAGRAAAIAGLAPVYGNLLHHAVEMYLKAALTRTMTLQHLKAMGHRVDRLWGAFKKVEGSARLVKHDGTFTALHAFEEIRYPDKALVHGMMSNVLGPGIHGAGVLIAGSIGSKRLPPTYEVQVAKVDQLVVEELWKACGMREGYVPSALVSLTKAGHRAATLRNRELKAVFRRTKK